MKLSIACAAFGFWLTDSCVTQLKAQGPSRTCNESKEEEDKNEGWVLTVGVGVSAAPLIHHSVVPGVVLRVWGVGFQL